MAALEQLPVPGRRGTFSLGWSWHSEYRIARQV